MYGCDQPQFVESGRAQVMDKAADIGNRRLHLALELCQERVGAFQLVDTQHVAYGI
jgi:hypothetical protein